MKNMTKKKFKSRPTFFEIFEKSQKMAAYKNAYKFEMSAAKRSC